MNILFIRGLQIHDPISGEYLNMFADPDGDGKTSYAEVVNGTDPKH